MVYQTEWQAKQLGDKANSGAVAHYNRFAINPPSTSLPSFLHPFLFYEHEQATQAPALTEYQGRRVLSEWLPALWLETKPAA